MATSVAICGLGAVGMRVARALGELPLITLRRFLTKHLKGYISAVHILPFYPYSSDDGFSVVSFDRNTLDLLVPHLGIQPTDDDAQIRFQIGDTLQTNS